MNYGTVPQQEPSGGQQTGVESQNQPKKSAKGASERPGDAPQHLGGEGSSSQPEGPPPTYADVIKGDHKVQSP